MKHYLYFEKHRPFHFI